MVAVLPLVINAQMCMSASLLAMLPVYVVPMVLAELPLRNVLLQSLAPTVMFYARTRLVLPQRQLVLPQLFAL
jgi:hypothetical protein